MLRIRATLGRKKTSRVPSRPRTYRQRPDEEGAKERDRLPVTLSGRMGQDHITANSHPVSIRGTGDTAPRHVGGSCVENAV